jgi:thiol:disulfide interchange protein DsbG
MDRNPGERLARLSGTIRRFAVALLVAALAGPALGAPAPVGPEKAYRDAARAHGISVGPTIAKDVVYVFFDPQCPHCAALWQAAKPLLGEVRMVWIPVAFLDSLSAPQGAALLGAEDPGAALGAHETRVARYDYGAMPAKVTPALLRAVKANTRLWIGIGADVVPYVLYVNARDGKAGVIEGRVPTAELKDRLGLP